MRTLVDIPKADIEALDELSARQGVSRAKVIRATVRPYIGANGHKDVGEFLGVWGEGEDGVEFQRRVRSEW
jgi:metal-responsive CopG/Arc/MetJ family transcriptional regulator